MPPFVRWIKIQESFIPDFNELQPDLTNPPPTGKQISAELGNNYTRDFLRDFPPPLLFFFPFKIHETDWKPSTVFLFHPFSKFTIHTHTPP